MAGRGEAGDRPGGAGLIGLIPSQNCSSARLRRGEGHPCYDRIFRAEAASVRRILIEAGQTLGPALGPEVMGRVELVLAELLNNVAEHGLRPDRCDLCNITCEVETGRPAPYGAAVIRLRVVAQHGGVACILTDNGIEIPPDCLTHPQFPLPSNLPEGGVGWPLIHDLTRQLHYVRDGQRNFLAFRIPA